MALPIAPTPILGRPATCPRCEGSNPSGMTDADGTGWDGATVELRVQMQRLTTN